MVEVIALILGGGGLLTGIAAVMTVVSNRKSSKETVQKDHGAIVFEAYNEFSEVMQRQVESLYARQDVLSVTIERQGEEIKQLRIELMDRDDKIRMLTLDRDDLVAIVTGPRPNLRTI